MSSQEKILESLIFSLSNLAKAGFKLMLRRENFMPVGIMTIRRSEIESSKGMSRTWAEGVVIEPGALGRGKFFKEPLDRWSGAKFRFEDTTLCDNPFGILITARRSSSIEDEDENFMYLENPLVIEESRRLITESAQKDMIVASLKRDMESLRKELNYWRDSAEAFGAEARDSRERLGTLQRRVNLLQSQVETYRTEAMVAEGLDTQMDAAVRKMVGDARERGTELASADVERAIGSAQKLRALREQMAGLVPGGGASDGEVRRLRTEVSGVKEKLDTLLKAAPAQR